VIAMIIDDDGYWSEERIAGVDDHSIRSDEKEDQKETP
jgi:hypothetical protein